ncbi:MAG: STAS/SEC14 domain-containing protein [Gammaproteobacteria bacterium]|nr:STAS/SEC14 domain-containing protein [Gammaproteobacteria bacterium]
MAIDIELLNVEGETDPRVIRATVSGQLQESDFHVLTPQVEQVLEDHASVRMLIQLSGFEGWSPGAAWEDGRLGIRHYADFERFAVVGDGRRDEWVTRLSKPFMLADVRFFEPGESNKALAWITEAPHPHIGISIEEDRKVVRVRPAGRLSRDDFIRLADEVDPVIEKLGSLNGLVIESRDFPGWDSVGALVQHLKFVSGHHHRVNRIALVTDSVLGRIAENIASHFISAEIKQFGAADLDVALQWAAKSREDALDPV